MALMRSQYLLSMMQLLVNLARYNSPAPLVFAVVCVSDFPAHRMIGQLPDLHVGVDTNRLHWHNLQRPVATESHITIPGSYVDEHPQATDGGPALQFRDQAVGLGPLVGATE